MQISKSAYSRSACTAESKRHLSLPFVCIFSCVWAAFRNKLLLYVCFACNCALCTIGQTQSTHKKCCQICCYCGCSLPLRMSLFARFDGADLIKLLADESKIKLHFSIYRTNRNEGAETNESNSNQHYYYFMCVFCHLPLGFYCRLADGIYANLLLNGIG